MAPPARPRPKSKSAWSPRPDVRGKHDHARTALHPASHGPAAAIQIRQAIDNGTRDTAIKLTHALKGRTGMLGVNELHSIAQSLEQCLKNGEPSTLWIEELESTVQEMSKAISSALGPVEA